MTKTIRLSLLLLCLSLLAGCATGPSQPTYFYRLNLLDETAKEPPSGSVPVSVQPLLGIGPVTLASYLDRPQIIRRVGPYQLELDDFHYWAGKLQENITLELTHALQRELGADKVVAFPWQRVVRPDYELTLEVTRLDAEADHVLLEASWTLIDARQNRLVDLHRVRIREPLQGSTPEAVVAGASRALQQLADRLTARLRPIL